jgi:cytosine/creatinine deaminase
MQGKRGGFLGSLRGRGVWEDVGMRDRFFNEAVAEARRGMAEGGIPIGSVLVHGGQIIGRGHNMRVQSGDPILHGEMSAIRDAGRRTAAVYRECTLYTTLSPCPMCSGTILLYRIPRVVVGENRTFMGQEDWLRSHGIEVEVLDDGECLAMMREFIAAHPDLWDEDIGEE